MIFLFGLLLLFAVNFQQPQAVNVDQDVGITYVIADTYSDNTFIPACHTPEVVYLGDSQPLPLEYENSSHGWLDQNTINCILISDVEMYFQDVGSNNMYCTYSKLLNLNGTITNKNNRQADLTRLDIGEIHGMNILSV